MSSTVGGLRGRQRRGRGRGRVQESVPDPLIEESGESSYPMGQEEEVAQSYVAPAAPVASQPRADYAEPQRHRSRPEPTPRRRMEHRIRVFETAVKAGAGEFGGTTDPFEADDWMRQLKKVFALMECPEEDMLACAVHLLKGDADVWWTNLVDRQADRGVVTWPFFQEQFATQFMPPVYRERKIQEFMSLRQGSSTVEEYRIRFQHLERFAGSLVPTEESRCQKFHRGLNLSVRTKMGDLVTSHFQTLVARALREEDLLREERESRDRRSGKRVQSGGPSSSHDDRPSKKKSVGVELSREEPQGEGAPAMSFQESRTARPCPRCGRMHGGRCRQGRLVCYACGEPGHFRRDCPQWQSGAPSQLRTTEMRSGGSTDRAEVARPSGGGGIGGGSRRDSVPDQRTTQARVYAMTRQGADVAAGVIPGPGASEEPRD